MRSPEARTGQDTIPGSSVIQAANHEAADKVMATYELVEMIICELPLIDIARAQRVCKTFGDIVKTSPSIRRVAARTPWLRDDVPAANRIWRWGEKTEAKIPQPSPMPFKWNLNFDNGHDSPAIKRFCSMKALHSRLKVRLSPALGWISFDNDVELSEAQQRSMITPNQEIASAAIWRLVPICRAGMTVKVGYNLNPMLPGKTTSFGPESTLEDLYSWLVVVQKEDIFGRNSVSNAAK